MKEHDSMEIVAPVHPYLVGGAELPETLRAVVRPFQLVVVPVLVIVGGGVVHGCTVDVVGLDMMASHLGDEGYSSSPDVAHLDVRTFPADNPAPLVDVPLSMADVDNPPVDTEPMETVITG